jgi:hypothetical protein
MRKLLLIALALMLAFAIVACRDSDSKNSSDSGSKSSAESPESEAENESESEPESESSTLLTPADVEQVSGLSGLKVVPYDPSQGAGGSVNIADADGQLVVMLADEGPDTWDAWSTDGITFGEPYEPVVGDESFVGPNTDTSAVPYIFAFRKGDRAISIDTYFKPTGGGGTILSVDQLYELALVVESRL